MDVIFSGGSSGHADPLPSARSHLAAASCGPRVLFAGGYNPQPTPVDPSLFDDTASQENAPLAASEISKLVQMYDPNPKNSGETWTLPLTLQEGRFSLAGSGFCTKSETGGCSSNHMCCDSTRGKYDSLTQLCQCYWPYGGTNCTETWIAGPLDRNIPSHSTYCGFNAGEALAVRRWACRRN